ncbi:histone H1-like [Coregonus clupeaformis]|uniref:histone H1-like n=1 Tax=Coregonus clupeaformis TaxID=59861 RepID=UPI001E1C8A60|nr:histone H1-like [Coregonus clupeaformis]
MQRPFRGPHDFILNGDKSARWAVRFWDRKHGSVGQPPARCGASIVQSSIYSKLLLADRVCVPDQTTDRHGRSRTAPAAAAQGTQEEGSSQAQESGTQRRRAHRQGCDRFPRRGAACLWPAPRRRWRQAATTWRRTTPAAKIAVKSLVTKGTLVQTKGTGASGSFKLNKKAAEAKRPAKKAAVPKVKKVAAKSPAQEAQEGSSQEGRRRKEVPKKAKKPATPKKAAKSPKKVKKPPQRPRRRQRAPRRLTKAAKPKAAKPKAAKPKKAAPKKK